MIERKTLTGKNINKLIDKALECVRPQSKEFYRGELRRDLLDCGESLISHHAGCGVYIKVILQKERIKL